MRSLLAALLILLAACFAVPAAAQVEGTWELVHINGDSLPAASPSEVNLIIEGMTWTLGAEKQLKLEIRFRITAADEEITSAQFDGTYRVEEDRLFASLEGTEPSEFRWTLREGTLRLTDDRKDEYLLAPAIPDATGAPASGLR